MHWKLFLMTVNYDKSVLRLFNVKLDLALNPFRPLSVHLTMSHEAPVEKRSLCISPFLHTLMFSHLYGYKSSLWGAIQLITPQGLNWVSCDCKKARLTGLWPLHLSARLKNLWQVGGPSAHPVIDVLQGMSPHSSFAAGFFLSILPMLHGDYLINHYSAFGTFTSITGLLQGAPQLCTSLMGRS